MYKIAWWHGTVWENMGIYGKYIICQYEGSHLYPLSSNNEYYNVLVNDKETLPINPIHLTRKYRFKKWRYRVKNTWYYSDWLPVLLGILIVSMCFATPYIF